MQRAYDQSQAQELVPLLESITREMAERAHEVCILMGRIAKIEGEPLSEEFMNLKAMLAVHRRELRLAGKELDRLGCVLDEARPGKIRIPGRDGELAHGFTFDPRSCSLRRVALDVKVA